MKRSLKILLALALVLALVLGNALPVLAETLDYHINVGDGETCEVDGIITEDAWGLWVHSDETEASCTVAGEVSSPGDSYFGGTLEVEARDTGSAKATVGTDVTATVEDGLAVNVHAEGSGSASAEIGGSVNGESIVYAGDDYDNGLYAPATDTSGSESPEAMLTVGGKANGDVTVTAEEGGSAEMTVGEGINGQATVMATNGSTASLTVEDGGITAKDPMGKIELGPPSALTVINGGSDASVDITGDIETNGIAAVFAYTVASDDYNDQGDSDSAKTTISLNGNINVASSEDNWGGAGAYFRGAEENSETDFTMTGDITVGGGEMGAGIYMDAEEKTSMNLTLTGDMTVDGEHESFGLYAEADDGAVITAVLTGDISVSGGDEGYTEAILIDNEASTVNVLVTGNVTAKGGESSGAYVGAESYYYYEGEESDIDMSQEYTGEDELEEDSTLVCGECEYDLYTVGKGDEKKYYAEVYSEEDEKWHYYLVTNLGEPLPEPDTDPATAGLVIEGDVTADAIGIALDANKCSTVDVVVDGTVEGGKGSLVLINDTQLGDSVTLTVWEVKPNADGALISDMEFDPESEGENYSLTQNKKAEAQLQYIIRVNAEQKDMITAGGAAQEYSAQGKTWKVAHEGETVTLLLQNIPEGYEITAAYGDVSQNLKLEKDKDGNYFLTVPRGGAVELSIVLSKLPDPEPDSEPEADTVMITYILGNDAQYDHIRTTAAIGEGVALQPAPEREGYTFLYWQCTDVDPNSSYYKQPDPQNDFQFRPGAIYTAKKDINFVAVWQKN